LLKAGILGFGKMGQIRARSIQGSKNIYLDGVYENTNHEVKFNNPTIHFYESVNELLKANLDVVFVCTYVSSAPIYVKQFLENGMHVFCEKPPALNSKQVQEIIEVERRSGAILKFGFNHRYHGSVLDAISLAKKKSLGKILWMRGVYGKAGSIDFSSNWRNYKEFSGGGILIDQGIHILDLFRHISQVEFKKNYSLLTNHYWDVECEDNAFIVLEEKDSTSKAPIIATLHSTANQWKHKFSLEITYENGYINLEGILSETMSYSPEKLTIAKKDSGNNINNLGKPSEEILYYDNDNSWNLELKEFVEAIENKTKIKNGNSIDALKVMELIDSIYENH
jgi:predicted dehydrogenase